MTSKIIIFAFAFVIIFTALAMADGGFFGTVGYGGNGCDYTNGDQVKVLNTDTDEWAIYYITRQGPAYNTANGPGRTTWPAGHYRIWVSKYQDGQCGPAVLQIVIHGSTDQQVNLTVLGPVGDPNRPQGP